MRKEKLPPDSTDPGSRRSFLGKLSVAVVGVMAWPLLSKSILSSRTRKSKIPPDLPGPGSIFQPRNDDR